MFMDAKDAVSGSLADLYVTIEEKRYHMIQATKLEAKIEKRKTEVPILGRTGTGHKANGWKGTGTMSLYYNTSVFRKLLDQYQKTGQDFYFDIQVRNEDPTSAVGGQIVMLRNCNMDGATLAKFDVSAEVLDEEISFTFDEFDIPEAFDALSGTVEGSNT